MSDSRSGTRLYKIWANMKERCNNSNAAGFQNYGGKAVDYIIPKAWVKIRPKRVLTDEQKEERRRNALKSILRASDTDK